MDKTVADLNIEHFKKLLETETDPVRRRTLQRLLAEEEAKLVIAMANKDYQETWELVVSGQGRQCVGLMMTRWLVCALIQPPKLRQQANANACRESPSTTASAILRSNGAVEISSHTDRSCIGVVSQNNVEARA